MEIVLFGVRERLFFFLSHLSEMGKSNCQILFEFDRMYSIGAAIRCEWFMISCVYVCVRAYVIEYSCAGAFVDTVNNSILCGIKEVNTNR